MKRLVFLFFILILLVLKSIEVLAPCVYREGQYDDGGVAGDCAELKIKNKHYDKLDANEIKDNLEGIPDLSKVRQDQLSIALKEKYRSNIQINSLPAGSKIEGDTLKAGDNTINLKELKGSHTIDFIDGRLLINGNQIQGAQNVMSTADGRGIQMLEVTSVDFDGAKILNAKNVVIFNDELLADYAQTYTKDNSIATDVKNLKVRKEKFAVGEAEKVVSGCNNFNNVRDSEFEIIGKDIKVVTNSNVTLNITDCSYRDIEFESKGNGSSVTIKKNDYEISKGKLKCGNRDSVEVEKTANIEVGSDCFTCLTINPPGTYFYSDADIRKDFNINVPRESSTYRLCLKKNIAQQFKDYNGLVDFVNKRVELNGIVNYLKYPLKNSQISSLLSSFVYRGLKDVKALLTYDKDLLFLENINIKNTIKNKNQITVTKPSNFYTIEEIELDGKVHRVVDLSLIGKEDATQNIVSDYGSDSLDADVNINDGILVQQIDESKVTILPPEHPSIGSFLR